MSGLSYLEKLLDGVEVEWETLGKLALLRRGRVMSKDYFVENIGDYPVYSSQTANNGMIGSIDTFDFDGEFVSWTTDGANAGTVFYRTGKFSITNVCGLINIKDSSPLNYKYLFYWLTIEAKKHVYSGMGNPKLMSHQVEKIPVPIPCPDNPEKSLAIQSEIVRILDTFTALTNELTNELKLRRQQYNYYREQLLSFKEGEVEWLSVSQIFNLKNGYTPSKSNKEYWENGDIPWFRMDDIRENGRILGMSLQKISYCAVKRGMLFPENSILISTSATIGEYALITVPHLANQRFTCLSLKLSYVERFNIKFLFYYCFCLADWCRKNTTMSSFASVDMDGFRKFLFPIPYPNNPEKSLAFQSEIVRILDKFDTLTSSISEGLPLEIELRKKQYEYYRDLLYSFPKPVSADN
ncbi:restriction endonuclease subunit S [Salmonella enterica]|uniref:restriction endonuclease subunit S n=1 Tax=Salmonella enterica TaxID=28901 RepID=UPI003A4C659E|nr:restriction endonuclease subunit S [Salmonella enterica subsp. enterica serovar Infantis]EEA0256468.1 restriction endonuclease subunit S [Salmonella enterica subsp. enterica serovar Infantis]